MALFPKVESPCPYVDRLAEIMEGDVCRMCRRQVFDLTAMDDTDRASFLAACAGDACVTYRLPVRATIVTAAALAGIALPLAAAAQDKPQGTPPVVAPIAAAEVDDANIIVVAGGLRPSRDLQQVPIAVMSEKELRRAMRKDRHKKR